MVVLSSEKTEEKEKEKEKEEEKTEKVWLSSFLFSGIIWISLNKTVIKMYLYLFEKQFCTSWMACICLPITLLLYWMCKNV